MSEAPKKKHKLQYKREQDFQRSEKPIPLRQFELSQEDFRPPMTASAIAEKLFAPTPQAETIKTAEIQSPTQNSGEKDTTVATHLSEDNPNEEKKLKRKLNRESNVFKPGEISTSKSIGLPQFQTQPATSSFKPISTLNPFESRYHLPTIQQHPYSVPQIPQMYSPGYQYPIQQAYGYIPTLQSTQAFTGQPFYQQSYQPIIAPAPSYHRGQALKRQMYKESVDHKPTLIENVQEKTQTAKQIQDLQLETKAEAENNLLPQLEQQKTEETISPKIQIKAEVDTQTPASEPMLETNKPVIEKLEKPIEKVLQQSTNEAITQEEKPSSLDKGQLSQAVSQRANEPEIIQSLESSEYQILPQLTISEQNETMIKNPPTEAEKNKSKQTFNSCEVAIRISKQEAFDKFEEVAPEAADKTYQSYSTKISEEEIGDFINSFIGELSDDMQILIRNIREVQNVGKSKYDKRYDQREGRGGKGRQGQGGQAGKGDYRKGQPAETNLTRITEKLKPTTPPPPTQTVTPALTRTNFTDERLKQIKEMKETSDIWLSTKIDDDEKVKQQRQVKQLLNKITADNFDAISDEILECCKQKFLADTVIEFVVMKAWREPRYTKTYAQLVTKLVKQKFDWDNLPKKDYIKKKVLNRVEEEYVEGFQKYYEFSKEIYNNQELTPQDRFEQLNKRKFTLIGNINFICELFISDILSFMILKMIVLYGIGNFLKEYLRTEVEHDKFTIKEDYLEALLKIFENLGKLIEKKEVTHKTKISKEAAIDDDVLEEVKFMLEETVDNTDRFLERDKLGHRVKNLYSLSNTFFEFIDIIKTRKIGARMESLIENLEQFRQSGWLVEIKKVSAAKSISQVKKELEMEKEEMEGNRMDYKEAEYYESDRYGGDSYRKKTRDYKKSSTKKEAYKKSPKVYASPLRYTIKEAGPTKKGYEDVKKEAASYIKSNKERLNPNEFKEIFLKNETTSGRDLLRAYLETFAFGVPKDVITKWTDLPEDLFKANIAKEADLIDALAMPNQVLYLEYSDAPLLLEFIARIFHHLWSQYWIDPANFDFSETSPKITDEDELEEYGYYMRAMKEQIKHVFTENGDWDAVSDKLNF